MAFEILYTIEDGKGKTSTTEVNLPTNVSMGNAIVFATEMAKIIDQLIGGRITRIGIAFVIDLPGSLKSNPQPDSDVEEGARFQFRTAGGFFTGFRLPTFLESFILPRTDAVKVTDANVASLIAAMQNGIDVDPSPTQQFIAPCDKRGDDIVGLNFARESFQSSRGRAS